MRIIARENVIPKAEKANAVIAMKRLCGLRAIAVSVFL